MHDVELRALRPDDCDLLYGWRNDPWIVSLSASQQLVAREEHDDWFAGVLGNKDALIRIICDSRHIDMGLVRTVKTSEHRATITIYLMQSFIGHGRGPQVIAMSCRNAFIHWPTLQAIDAWIRADNSRSISAFTKVGFKENQSTGAKSEELDMVQMSLERVHGILYAAGKQDIQSG